MLSKFSEWITKSTFFPAGMGVSVTVSVENGPDPSANIDFDVCMSCSEILTESHILDRIDGVNWSRIGSLDIKHTVVSNY